MNTAEYGAPASETWAHETLSREPGLVNAYTRTGYLSGLLTSAVEVRILVFTHSVTHSLTHSLIHYSLFTCSFAPFFCSILSASMHLERLLTSVIEVGIHSVIHSFVQSFLHPFVLEACSEKHYTWHPPFDASIPPLVQFTEFSTVIIPPFIQISSHSSIHSSIESFIIPPLIIRFLCSSVHPSISLLIIRFPPFHQNAIHPCNFFKLD